MPVQGKISTAMRWHRLEILTRQWCGSGCAQVQFLVGWDTSIYEDKIYVWNDGKWPENLPVDEIYLLGKSVATTKRYLNRLCEIGIWEQKGNGISNPIIAGIIYWIIRILACAGCLVGAGILLAFIGIKIAGI